MHACCPRKILPRALTAVQQSSGKRSHLQNLFVLRGLGDVDPGVQVAHSFGGWRQVSCACLEPPCQGKAIRKDMRQWA
eukprot:12318714-Alexandrium_andersonii.AAC.2